MADFSCVFVQLSIFFKVLYVCIVIFLLVSHIQIYSLSSSLFMLSLRSHFLCKFSDVLYFGLLFIHIPYDFYCFCLKLKILTSFLFIFDIILFDIIMSTKST